MSRHKLYANYDHEKDMDEFDTVYGDEEDGVLSPEDEHAMITAVPQVRQALGVDEKAVSTAQIQEALWHYYFDVDKSAAYLTSKYISPPASKPAKKAPEAEAGFSDCYSEEDRPARNPSQRGGRESFASFFFDMPWLNTPVERQTVFNPPTRPSGGLLGGSGAPPKMSKLQALAAARKKKAEERRAEERKTEEKRAEEKQEVPQKQMEGLSINDSDSRKENAKPTLGTSAKRRKLSESAHDPRRQPPRVAPSPAEAEESADVTGDPLSVDEEDCVVQTARPSAFAQTLVGSASKALTAPQQQFFTLPYMAFAPSIADAFSRPSPDDVVLAAQAQAGKQKAAAAAKKTSKPGQGDGISEGVKALKVEDAPLPKSKNLNVLNEFEKSKSKRNASFVVVGHVDAGKSTLMGRLLLDLNIVDERTVQKYRKEAESIGKSSFALAWILDQRSEERSRGVTIDIATNRFETETTSFTILDAPGHKDFIPNMIAGASQADFAVLVIDSSTGAFESGLKGQTREHSLLIRSMGVSRIIVAVNKLDTTNWSQERYDEICQQVSGFLSATGFQMQNISFVPLSGLNGDNLVRRSESAAASWYTGPTLIQELENSEPMARALHEPLRMTISEVFRTTTSPLTISGRLDAGSVQAGDALLVQPSGEKAYVKAIELDSEPVDWAVAGQNVVLHLSNIDPIHVRVGDIVCDPAKPINCVDTFTVKVLAFDILMPMQVDVHRGRLHAPGQISEMKAILNKTTGAVTKQKPRIIKAGSAARIVVKMASRVPLEPGQRVVLRSNGVTVAAGLLE